MRPLSSITSAARKTSGMWDFGALYMYRYCQERGAVQVEIGATEPLKK